MPNSTQPPPKPDRKPPRLPATAPRITQDLVRPIPGYPSAQGKPDASVIAAARAAARQSSPDLIEHRLTGLEHDVSGLNARLHGIELGQDRVVNSVNTLTAKVNEWEVANSGAAITKVQEEQKTKRFSALVSVMMAIVTIAGTIATNIAMRPDPPAVTQRRQPSANDIAIATCKREHRGDTKQQAKCITDIAIANITPVD